MHKYPEDRKNYLLFHRLQTKIYSTVYHLQWQRNNKEHYNKYHLQWQKNNRERKNIQNIRYRKRMKIFNMFKKLNKTESVLG